jgi:hypothetical protein
MMRDDVERVALTGNLHVLRRRHGKWAPDWGHSDRVSGYPASERPERNPPHAAP